MIPVRLELKNFLPYTTPDPIRFEGIHLACLTGSNGAGKSSILDAITWALWGKARAKRDDELIHLDKPDMYVQLDFEQEGALYRVLRRRSAGKRGQGTLDLFVFREDGSPNNISERGMRETQAKIEALLRMDYDTFTHSAFLQQGKADAFSTKSPAERKKILSDILGLDRWARYEDEAKNILKGISSNLNYFEQRIREIDEELAKKPGLERDRDEADTHYREAQEALREAEALLRELDNVPGDLRSVQDQRLGRERRLREINSDQEGNTASIERTREQIASYQQVIDAREQIEAGYAALESAREADQALSDKLIQLNSLNEERYALRSKIDKARSRIEGEINTRVERIAELEASSADATQDELEQVEAQITALLVREAERDQMVDQRNENRVQVGALESTLAILKTEGTELNERIGKLESAKGDSATCPLCGQPLGKKEREKLVVDLGKEVERKRQLYSDTLAEINSRTEQVKGSKSLIDAINNELAGLPELRQRVGTLKNRIETARLAAERIAEDREAVAQLQAQLEAEAYAEEERARLQELDALDSELAYDEGSHSETREQLTTYREYEQLRHRLTIALESLPQHEQSLADALSRQERLAQAYAETEAEMKELDSEIIRLKELLNEYELRDQKVRTQRTLELSAHERLVSARQALDSLAAQATRKLELTQMREEAREQEALYSELRQAFGKNGVPAMIIETAIPELENTANYLLSKMTEGRMHLRMSTQREKVTGGVAETLDIDIADELGTRNYELYSGGESFRIDFAIRVALSQMLARRAGAHLRTLFIDEGFGTQDEAGRGKLVEAINMIQDEFDLILVITHIDELRDSFPVHIAIEKTPNGSQIQVQ